jgi:hypothetical protein
MIRLLRRRMEIPDSDREAVRNWTIQVMETQYVAERDWLLEA